MTPEAITGPMEARPGGILDWEGPELSSRSALEAGKTIGFGSDLLDMEEEGKWSEAYRYRAQSTYRSTRSRPTPDGGGGQSCHQPRWMVDISIRTITVGITFLSSH